MKLSQTMYGAMDRISHDPILCVWNIWGELLAREVGGPPVATLTALSTRKIIEADKHHTTLVQGLQYEDTVIAPACLTDAGWAELSKVKAV